MKFPFAKKTEFRINIFFKGNKKTLVLATAWIAEGGNMLLVMKVCIVPFSQCGSIGLHLEWWHWCGPIWSATVVTFGFVCAVYSYVEQQYSFAIKKVLLYAGRKLLKWFNLRTKLWEKSNKSFVNKREVVEYFWFFFAGNIW